ncbi:PD-(D/E)XK nuclease-like domain-containing protein [Propionibacterium phage B22]|uniref:RecE n=2 Tax=root TaxID=1 RepID=A0A1D8ETS2_9CAUD|nr:PD-(D/E)XK nuclease-like domain-containing protein [Propionibacterium phage B22]AOT24390.1 RecE [Propionibacterium phage B22]CEH08707.1 Gp60 [Propionibacterium freudenreichii]SBW77633.1 RecE [Propionibacterium freudenreichii]
MMPITKPCAVKDMPEGEYHSDPCVEPSLSSTMAKTIVSGEAGPARLREIMSHGQEHKAVFDFGSAAHEKVLGRGAGVEVLDFPAWTTKASREARQAVWDAGGTPVLAKDSAQVDAMAEAILSNPVAGELFTRGAGSPELSMFTIDEETGRWQRGRLDFLADRKTIVDFKTSGQSVELPDWIKHSWQFGYHIQAAAYMDQAISLDLVDEDAIFLHVVQETKPPFLLAIYQVSADQLAEGRRQMRRALDLWDRCLTLDEWPAIPAVIQLSKLPDWVHTTDDEKDS